MFTFKSIVNSKNIWKLCFRDKEEITRIYCEDHPKEDGRVLGLTDYINSIIYIDSELDGSLLGKILRHELTHIYLWETAQQDRIFNEEEVCDLMSVAAPLIYKLADEIMFRLKEGLYKKGE